VCKMKVDMIVIIHVNATKRWRFVRICCVWACVVWACVFGLTDDDPQKTLIVVVRSEKIDIANHYDKTHGKNSDISMASDCDEHAKRMIISAQVVP